VIAIVVKEQSESNYLQKQKKQKDVIAKNQLNQVAHL
jgi:hypothetical protein